MFMKLVCIAFHVSNFRLDLTLADIADTVKVRDGILIYTIIDFTGNFAVSIWGFVVYNLLREKKIKASKLTAMYGRNLAYC